MKKALSLVAVLGLLSIVGCGGGDDEPELSIYTGESIFRSVLSGTGVSQAAPYDPAVPNGFFVLTDETLPGGSLLTTAWSNPHKVSETELVVFLSAYQQTIGGSHSYKTEYGAVVTVTFYKKQSCTVRVYGAKTAEILYEGTITKEDPNVAFPETLPYEKRDLGAVLDYYHDVMPVIRPWVGQWDYVYESIPK